MLEVFFYLFSIIAVIACLMVILSNNAVHSVLYLILAYFNVAGLFVLIGAEFMSMLLMVVYVGAVAVLFLFVVMMLDVDYARLKSGFVKHLPIVMLVSAVFVGEIIFSVSVWIEGLDQTTPLYTTLGIKEIGNVLYTEYVFYFQMSGLVLLVAMIGAIGLTLQKNDNPKRQDTVSQIHRVSKIDLVDPVPASGLER